MQPDQNPNELTEITDMDLSRVSVSRISFANMDQFAASNAAPARPSFAANTMPVSPYGFGTIQQ
jgi:hypothetical protein